MELIIKPLTKMEFDALAARYGDYFKVTVDIERQVLVAGCSLHADGEEILLKEGSKNDNIWGGGIRVETLKIDNTAVLNFRPRLNNDSMEIQDSKRKEKFLAVVNRLMFSIWK